jgi:flavodoxin
VNSLVVYYSRTGRTKAVAQTIASDLRGDVEEVIDTCNRRGIIGYLRAAWDAYLKRETEIEPVENDPRDYDIVVVGGPIWNWSVCAPIRTYLADLSARAKRTAFFCTMDGAGDTKVFVEMTDLCGKPPVDSSAFTKECVADGSFRAQAKGFAAKLKSHFGLV